MSDDSSEDEAPDPVSEAVQNPPVQATKRQNETPLQSEKPAKRPFAPAKKVVKKGNPPVTK